MDAGQRIDRVDAVRDQGRRPSPRPSSSAPCRVRPVPYSAVRSDAFLAQMEIGAVACLPVALTKPGPACAFPALRRLAATRIPRDQTCTATAPIPAARSARADIGQDVAAVRLVPPHPRPRRRAVHRPARPLRPDPGGGRPGLARPSRSPRRCARNGWCGSTARCASARTAPRTRTCRPARSRSISARSRCSGPAGELPMPVFGDQEYPEEIRLKYRFLDLRREQLHHNIMMRGQVIDSIRRRMKESGFFEFQTPILTASSPEGARDYPGAVAAASRKVLRAAAGAAAVQAAHHGRGLRPLFPDRAVLPRRGRARRPFAGRVLSARSRDELRHAAGRVRRGRAGDARRVRGVRERQAGDAEIPAHSLCRGDAQIRHRQAGPAQPDRDAGRERSVPRLRLQDLRQHPRRRSEGGGVGDPGAERRQPRLLRPHEFMGARRRPAGPRLHLLARGRGERRRSARQEHRAGAHQADRATSSASASATRCSSSPAGRSSS